MKSTRIPTILYVEDNDDDAALVKSALIEVGVSATLHVVINAVQAFAFLVKQQPYEGAPDVDLVLLDLNLPIIDGVRALTIIKTSSDLKSVAVVIFTSSERPDERIKCERLGVVSYLIKPSVYEGFLALASDLKFQLEHGTCISGDVA